MTELTKILAGIILALQAWLGANSPGFNNSPPPMPGFSYATTTMSIGGTKISVKVADTEAKRERGLSDAAPLAKNEGMLFIFDQPDYYQFWMKDMNYPLDIIWLDQNHHIVDIAAGLATSTYPQSFQSQKPAQYVLEVGSGFSRHHSLKIGEIAEF